MSRPHSYTAQPVFEIVAPLRRRAPFFAKPIMLEEFGYPTDPITQPSPARPAGFKETSIDVLPLPGGAVPAARPPGAPWAGWSARSDSAAAG